MKFLIDYIKPMQGIENKIPVDPPFLVKSIHGLIVLSLNIFYLCSERIIQRLME